MQQTIHPKKPPFPTAQQAATIQAIARMERAEREVQECRQALDHLGDHSTSIQEGIRSLGRRLHDAEHLAKGAISLGTQRTLELEQARAAINAMHQTPSIDVITLKIQGALGSGIDEQDWKPGEHWLDAAIRVLRERHALRARVVELLGDLQAKEEVETKLLAKIDARDDIIRGQRRALEEIHVAAFEVAAESVGMPEPDHLNTDWLIIRTQAALNNEPMPEDAPR